jgi:DNA (cytosine-5)-methyltransferase 1
MTMTYGSVCSGVEAATVAWHSLGWRPQWFSEIEKFPSAVLKHHYPSVPNRGDMTNFKEWPDEPIDVLVGGTPCQSFSVAGLRKGLDDPRGNLMLTYLAIAAKYRPKWLVWENVPGVLSSNGGLDFASLLRGMGELGYGFAYRILDAQYFGVAQRRRRVFVVGYAGNWQRAAAVLFERDSLQGNPAPRREKGEKVADTLTVGANQYSGFNGEPVAQCLTTRTGTAFDPFMETMPIAFATKQQSMKTSDNVANTLGANDYKEPQAVAIGWSNELNTLKDLQPTIQRGGAGGRHDGVMIPPSAVAYDSAVTAPLNTQLGLRGPDVSNSLREGVGIGNVGDPAFTLQASHGHGVITPSQVRRLTPIECERLQGFPDNYTDIRLNDKQTPDGPRYKSMGNSMAVPVMRWIGERIQKVEDIQ